MKKKKTMSILLNKYGLKLSKKGPVWFSQTDETTIEGKIIAEIFSIQNSVFEIREIINQVQKVKYEINESFSIYAEYANGSIFCRKGKVYITINEDEKERENQKITCAYDTIAISDLELLLDELHSNSKTSMSTDAIEAQNLKYKVDDFFRSNHIDEIIEVKYHSNSICCISSDFRIDLKLTDDGLDYMTQNIRTKTILSNQNVNLNELNKTLVGYLDLIRPNQNWRT